MYLTGILQEFAPSLYAKIVMSSDIAVRLKGWYSLKVRPSLLGEIIIIVIIVIIILIIVVIIIIIVIIIVVVVIVIVVFITLRCSLYRNN